MQPKPKNKIADFLAMMDADLEQVKSEGFSEKMESLKIQGFIGMMVEGFQLYLENSQIEDKEKDPTAFYPKNFVEWFYFQAWKGVCESMMEELIKDGEPIETQGFTFSFPFPHKKGEVPKLVIQRGKLEATDTGYHHTPVEDFQPHKNGEKMVNWYNNQKTPIANLAKLHLMMNNPAKKQAALSK